MALIGYTISAEGVTRLRVEAQRRRLVLGEVLWERAGDPRRPKWRELLAKLESGEASGLLVMRLVRVAPSLAEALRLAELVMDRGRSLHSIAEGIDGASQTGLATTLLLAELSRWWRERHSEATRAALAHKLSRGEVLGAAPFGWRKVPGADGKLTALDQVPDEQRVIARVRELRERQPDGRRLSHDRIAAMMQAAGCATRSGRPWSRRIVQVILDQPEERYAKTPEPFPVA